MNKAIWLIFIIFATGCSDTIVGDLEVLSRDTLKVFEDDGNTPVHFQNGRLSIKIKEEGYIKGARLELSQEETSSYVKIFIPGDIIAKNMDFNVTGEEIGQTFDLKGSLDTFDYSENENEEEVSCSYNGHCNKCGMKANGDLGCSYGYNLNCPGKRRALVHYKIHLEAYFIRFLAPRDQSVFATFNTDPVERKTSDVLEYRSTCK